MTPLSVYKEIFSRKISYHYQNSFELTYMSMIRKSQKLINVCYDIRGPVLEEAKRLEDEGSRIIKLNIGNPAPFGFEAPEEIVQDVILNLPNAQGYCDSKGLFAARKAVCMKVSERTSRTSP